MESKLKCYKISGYCGHSKFQETTYSPTQARAVSNVKWKVHKIHPYVYMGDISVTAVQVYNNTEFRFEPTKERLS